MAWNNKVIWSEGMFLRPQHFQQQTRYLEHFIESRCGAFGKYGWGFSSLKIDEPLLGLGKFAVSEARGIFPDGTPFNIPELDDPPPPKEISEMVHDSVIYLSLPLRRVSAVDADLSGEYVGLTRNRSRNYEVMDTTATSAEYATSTIEVGKLHLNYLLEDEQRSDYACLGTARIVECKADKSIVLDSGYIPTVVDCQVAAGLTNLLNELSGLLHHRGEALAGRVSVSGRGSAAEIADFLFLQVVNRYSPLINHLAGFAGLHPEELYRLLLELSGELSTFTRENRRAVDFPSYQHHALSETLTPVMDDLRQSLTRVLEQTAISIPMQEKKYGIRIAVINDKTLLDSASWVIAVHADMPTEVLRNDFPARVKIGSVEQIQELVNIQLPGIKVHPLPVAPRQIPYHAGSVYFELEKQSKFWKNLKDSGALATHLSGSFPGIEMELWAIKG